MVKLNKKRHPHFICPGAAKSGTTTLFSILENHKDIYLYSGKEIGFFGKERRFKNGYEWYLKSYFSEYKEGQISGDISTNYMTYSKVAARRIYDCLGSEVKLIFLLRNPVDRAYSHFNMRKYNNLSEGEDFSSLVSKLNINKKSFTENQINRLSCDYGILTKEEQLDWKILNYFFLGNYSSIIEEYLKYFSKKNVLVIKFEDFIVDQVNEMKKIYSFLDISSPEERKVKYSNPSGKIKYVAIHKFLKSSAGLIQKIGLGKLISNNKKISKLFYHYKNWNREVNKVKPISKEDKNQLDKYYREDILKLEELTGVNFKDWLNKD